MKIFCILYFSKSEQRIFEIVTKCPSNETDGKVFSGWRMGGFPTQLSWGVICSLPVEINLNQQKVVV
jgi:hypothetical protein